MTVLESLGWFGVTAGSVWAVFRAQTGPIDVVTDKTTTTTTSGDEASAPVPPATGGAVAWARGLFGGKNNQATQLP